MEARNDALVAAADFVAQARRLGMEAGPDSGNAGTRPSKRFAKEKAAVDKASWQKRPSPAPASSGNIARGRGVAVTQRSNTYIAIVAEVEVNKSSGQVAVKRIVCSHDCGLMINPDTEAVPYLLTKDGEGERMKGTIGGQRPEGKYFRLTVEWVVPIGEAVRKALAAAQPTEEVK